MTAAHTYKILSTVMLVNSATFSGASVTDQTAALASNTTNLPVVFVSSFHEYTNKVRLREKLLQGEDVSLELEFNGITLSDEDKKVIQAFRGVYERLIGAGDLYPWTVGRLDPTINYLKTVITRGSYRIGVKTCEKLWGKAALLWSKDPKDGDRLSTFYTAVGGQHQRTTHVYTNRIEIGCQTIYRQDMEAAAKHYGWDVPSA